MRPWAARLCVVLCIGSLGALVGSPALAARDADVDILDVPAQFVSGSGAETLRIVATQDGDEGCTKLRWSMVLRLSGVDPSDVRVQRVEENGEFPVSVRDEGGAATRLTDQQPDPGTLCNNREVTARYQVRFADDSASGSVTFQVEAYDPDVRELFASDTVTRQVVGDPDQSPSPEPTEEPSPTTPPPVAGQAGGRPAGTSTTLPIPPLGFIVGAVLVFFGAGLLLYVRRSLRRTAPARRPVRRPAVRGPRPQGWARR
jgi:hypothetical protein